MKKLIVIGAYPNTPKKEEVLINEINSLTGLGFDIMVVSHYPVSIEIQDMVDYYIYDKNQTLTPLDKSPYYWFKTDSFFIRVNNSRHALPICQNMFNAFKFSEIKKYDFVYFIENDNMFSLGDSKKLVDLVDEMFNSGKKCIFFKPEGYRDNGSYVYETQLFGITPSFFNDVLTLPISENEWYEHQMPNTLELAFYNKLQNHENDFLIINEHSSEYFKESDINIFRVENFILELLYNINDPSTPILYCYSEIRNRYNYKVVITINDNVIEDRYVYPTEWFYIPLSLRDDKLIIEVYDDNKLESKKIMVLNTDILDSLKERGSIEFNQ
jgi:hypothetical protein